MAKPGMNSKPWKQFVADINRPGPEMNQFFEAIGGFYLAQLQREFKANSRGGGAWKAVKGATAKAQFRRKKARKGHKGPRKKAILIDDGTLEGALTPGAKGNEFRLIPHGIRVGFSQAIHSTKSGITMNELAQIHDQGKGDMPKRQILNEPTQPTIKRMEGAVRDALSALGRKAERLRNG